MAAHEYTVFATPVADEQPKPAACYVNGPRSDEDVMREQFERLMEHHAAETGGDIWDVRRYEAVRLLLMVAFT